MAVAMDSAQVSRDTAATYCVSVETSARHGFATYPSFVMGTLTNVELASSYVKRSRRYSMYLTYAFPVLLCTCTMCTYLLGVSIYSTYSMDITYWDNSVYPRIYHAQGYGLHEPIRSRNHTTARLLSSVAARQPLQPSFRLVYVIANSSQTNSR